jgi:hypothetical protein
MSHPASISWPRGKRSASNGSPCTPHLRRFLSLTFFIRCLSRKFYNIPHSACTWLRRPPVTGRSPCATAQRPSEHRPASKQARDRRCHWSIENRNHTTTATLALGRRTATATGDPRTLKIWPSNAMPCKPTSPSIRAQQPLAHFFELYDRRPALALSLILHSRRILQSLPPIAWPAMAGTNSLT